jgi:lysyl-tRNA synthetase class 2
MIKTLKKVDSSMVSALGYDRENHVLEAVFKKGTTWQYLDVPPSVYKELCNSDSIGGYMRDLIIDEYESRKLKG